MIESKSNGRFVPSPVAMAAGSGRRPRLVSLALVAPLAVSLSACSSMVGTTYGTGETQEQALMRDVTNLFGVIPAERKEPINYRARAGLVVPPEGAPLPTPENTSLLASNASNNWPTDPDALRAAYQERVETMTPEEREQLLAEMRKLPKEQRDAFFKNNPSANTFINEVEEPDFETASADEMRDYYRQVEERKALIRLKNGENVKGRKYLTQPPERFTDVSPEVQQEIARIEQEGETKGREARPPSPLAILIAWPNAFKRNPARVTLLVRRAFSYPRHDPQ